VLHDRDHITTMICNHASSLLRTCNLKLFCKSLTTGSCAMFNTSRSFSSNAHSPYSENNRQRACQYVDHLHDIKWKLRRRVKKDQTRDRKSAVLISLCEIDTQPSILFTLRSTKVGSHKGEVSFPGGACDEKDASVVDTALRETEEELGFPRHQVDVWTNLPPILDSRGGTVHPVIGNLGKVSLDKLVLCKNEVAEVFTVPITHLCNTENHGYTAFRPRLKHQQAGISRTYRMPVFLHPQHNNIWGLTGLLLDAFLGILLPHDYSWITAHQMLPSVADVEKKMKR